MLRSSALSINKLLTFDMRNLNEAIFLRVTFLFFLLALSVPVTLTLPFKTIYASP